MAYRKLVEKHADKLYLVFRVFVGLLFFQHGGQKLLGLFGGVDGAGGTAELFSLFGLAGVIELFGGLAIALGLFTRLVALVAALEMAYAYLTVHMPQALAPINNGGELALLFFPAFLVLLAYGAGKWSLERSWFKEEVF